MPFDIVLSEDIDRIMIGTNGLRARDKYEPTNERLPCSELLLTAERRGPLPSERREDPICLMKEGYGFLFH